MKILIYSEGISYKKRVHLIINQLSRDKKNEISYQEETDFVKRNIEEFDVYVFVVYHLETLKQLQKKVKKGNQVLVITDNTDVNFILTCIEYTKNLIYLKVPISKIVQKILSIHHKNEIS